MTRTTEASQIRVGDQIRDEVGHPFVTVIERESFKRGTRIWLRLENGTERTLVSCHTLVMNTERV